MAGPFRVVIGPRPVRLLDALHVYCGGAEIWLPIVWRLRLRNAVRLVLVENALEMFASADLVGSERPAPAGSQACSPIAIGLGTNRCESFGGAIPISRLCRFVGNQVE